VQGKNKNKNKRLGKGKGKGRRPNPTQPKSFIFVSKRQAIYFFISSPPSQ